MANGSKVDRCCGHYRCPTQGTMAAEAEMVATEMVRSSWTKSITWSFNLHNVMSNWEWKARERNESRILRFLA